MDTNKIWSGLRFLESTTNLKSAVQRLSGRQPSASLLVEIATCLLHGRLFFENASKSTLEIKPLLLHYSAINFSKALILSRKGTRLATLPQAHGLKFKSSSNGQAMVLGSIKVGSKGTFQELNNVISELCRFRYIDHTSMPRTVNFRSAPSNELEGIDLSLQEIFQHIPYIEETYVATFNTPSAGIRIDINNYEENQWTIRIDENELFSDRESIKRCVLALRTKLPFLERWQLISATRAWGKSVFQFINILPTTDISHEIENLQEQDAHFYKGQSDAVNHFDALQDFPPLAGGYSAHPYYLPPIAGIQLSEFSIALMGLHALSSIVRYQPHVWTAAISRRSLPEGAQDDHVLALIEEFLESPSANFANLVATLLLEGE